MPDHIHGIIIINEKRDSTTAILNSSFAEGAQNKFISTSQTIGAIMRGFMGTVTRQINQLRGTPDEKIWQVNYWDRIIRTEKAFLKISTYIQNNPKKWKN